MERTFFSVTSILLISGICNAADATAQEDAYKYDGNTVTFHSRKFETRASGKMDTVRIVDPIDGKEIIKVMPFPPMPVSWNGRKIYEINDVVTTPWNDGIAIALEEHLLNSIKNDKTLQSFTDGTFSLSLRNIVIDEQGHVVYYELNRFMYTGADGQPRSLNTSGIDRWMQQAPTLLPAVSNGKNVMARLNTSISDNYTITVTNHVITIKKKGA